MTPDTHAELDPQLEEWLAEAREMESSAEPAADLDEMLEDVEKEMTRADESWLFWLRSRATWIRRGLASLTATLVVIAAGALTLRSNFSELPLAWSAIAVGSLATLLALTVYHALRPLHEPPLSPWVRGSMIAATLAATFSLALFAPDVGFESDHPGGLLWLTSPCLFYGLGVGLPVYFVLRLLDRGGGLALIAACAAGLTGNLVLELHCPSDDPEHLMLSHFTVALFFVAGLGVIHWIVERIRR